MPDFSPAVLAIDGPFQHELIHTRGTRLHAALAGDSSDPLVLFMHDCLGGWFDYQYMFEPLARDFHVAAMSSRGFGQSDKPPSGYTVRYAVGDASGMIRALGHGKATIVASGSAARVATVLAANYRERVRSLVLIDPALRHNPRRYLAARNAHRFPDYIARTFLPHEDAHCTSKVSGAVKETAQLRSLAYQIGGTGHARVKHSRLPGSPLPITWESKFNVPTHFMREMPQLTNPDQLCEKIYLSTHS